MPETTVCYFATADKTVPLLEWMDSLKTKAQNKCFVKIERLKEMGHELRRPEADILRDGIYELRIKYEGVPHRILYFFHSGIAILSHGTQKEDVVPNQEIDKALKNKRLYIENPQLHTYQEEDEDENA
jgi:hypothetical protein